MTFYNKTVEESLSTLNTSEKGLSGTEAAERLAKNGGNVLAGDKSSNFLLKFLQQFANPMVIILVVAAAISGRMGEIVEMLVIFAVVLINAIMGVVQEGKAEQAISKLKSMSTPYVSVRRDGTVKLIASAELVVGDIVEITAGDMISADIRLIKSNNIKAEEAALTGESMSVSKNIDVINKDEVIVGDRKNMLFSSDKITYGTGLGVVTHTAMDTEIGRIAGILKETKVEKTPLQKKLGEISLILTIAVLGVCVVIFGINLMWYLLGINQNLDPVGLFTMSVSIAVAAIPEGLVAVVTLVLAIGVQKMSRRRAIIRKLNAVETLGCVQYICSDKTGTLTQNIMTVQKNYIDGKIVGTEIKSVSGSDYFLKALVLCNDTKFSEGKMIGDPTETALITLAEKNGITKQDYDKRYTRVFERPFDSDRKLMTTVNNTENGVVAFTKGAVDNLVKICSHIQIGNAIVPFTEAHRDAILKANKDMAAQALRVLGAAFKPLECAADKVEDHMLEKSMIFCGLTGMIDPARPEAKDAIEICKRAGIKVVMITGDHRDTAIAIAKELNILSHEKYAITGEELDKFTPEQLKEKVSYYRVYARVSPEHKVRIVKALQANGNTVAMTGDGVNDAPALKTADIGVGMGITGSDVSKDVADMILTDDNFATIVDAVEEGRRIYANIKKSIRFLLSSNTSEILLLFAASLMQGITILHTVQILFINLITDTFPAIALGQDNAESDIMDQPPRRAKEGFFNKALTGNILLQGLFMAALTFGAFKVGDLIGSDHEEAITMAFASLSLIQLFHSLNIHKERKTILGGNILGNKFLIISILALIVFTVGIIQIPAVATILESRPLSFIEWLVVFGFSFAIIPVVEVMKLVSRLIYDRKIIKVS